MEDVPVVILAGGLGMRIREETEFRPKPMIPIGGHPILWHIMRMYSHHGFKRFLLCLGYKGEVIKDYFLHYDALRSDFTIRFGRRKDLRFHDRLPESGWTVTLADTGRESMTGARLQRAGRYLRSKTFMLTYGDGLADVDLRALLRFHRAHGKLATVTGVSPPSRFGELVTRGRRVARFTEKPSGRDRQINGGFFVLERRALSYLSSDPSCSFEREPLERLAADGQLMVYEHRGFWQCLDTMRDLARLVELWEGGEAPWKVWKD